MQQQELEKLMADSAEDAVKITQEEIGQVLDFTLDSVVHVDTAIHHFLDTYREEALEDKTIFTLCHMYGAYLGETFKKLLGGNWLYDESKPEAPHVFWQYQDKTFAFSGVCYERLVRDSEISVAAYFAQALDQSKQALN